MLRAVSLNWNFGVLQCQLLGSASQGAQDKVNVVAIQSSEKSLKAQPVLEARRMCSAQRHHQQSLTEGSIALQVKIFVFLLCLPSKDLTAVWFSSVLMIDFSWMLGWELTVYRWTNETGRCPMHCPAPWVKPVAEQLYPCLIPTRFNPSFFHSAAIWLLF